MTAAELRGLLERVEAHGGPITLADHPHHSEVYLNWGDEGSMWHYLDDCVRPSVESTLVGVLKRDLIEREVGWFRTDRYEDGLWIVTVEDVVVFGQGDSELEAVLKAYLAVAEAEGWTA